LARVQVCGESSEPFLSPMEQNNAVFWPQPYLLLFSLIRLHSSSSFGRLRHRLWDEPGVRLMYEAVVLPSLLYGCENLTNYHCHIKILEQFQQRCLRSTCGIKWKDKVFNVEVLERCGVPSVECQVIKAQLRWVRHLARIEDTNIPKAVFYSQLNSGKSPVGRSRQREKDTLKHNFKVCSINPDTWETTA